MTNTINTVNASTTATTAELTSELPTLDADQLAASTGGIGAGWLANHPYAAEAFLSHHPVRAAQFDANHPYAAARIQRIAG